MEQYLAKCRPILPDKALLRAAFCNPYETTSKLRLKMPTTAARYLCEYVQEVSQCVCVWPWIARVHARLCILSAAMFASKERCFWPLVQLMIHCCWVKTEVTERKGRQKI